METTMKVGRAEALSEKKKKENACAIIGPPFTNSDSSWMSPRDVDVIFGRGRPYQNHPGNKLMNVIVKQYQSFYQQAERGVKAQILKNIVIMLTGDGNSEKYGSIRFLKRAHTTTEEENQSIYSAQWTEATDEEILDKVSHLLREKTRRTCRSTSSGPRNKNIAKGPQQVNQQIVAATNTVNGGAPARSSCQGNDRKLHYCKTASRDHTNLDPYHPSSDHPSSSTTNNSFDRDDDEYHHDEDCLKRYFRYFHLCGPGPPPSPSIFDEEGDTTDPPDPPESNNPNFVTNRTAWL